MAKKHAGSFLKRKSASHARRVYSARFREWLTTHALGGGWGLTEEEAKAEVEAYELRWDRSNALEKLADSEISFQGFGDVMCAIERFHVDQFMDGEREKPLESFDRMTRLSTKELKRREKLFQEVSELLDDPEDAGAMAEHLVDHDAADAVVEIARRYGIARAARRNIVQGIFHPKRPPQRQPGAARIIGEVIDHHLADWPIKKRDCLAAHLFLDFFSDSDSPAEIEAAAKRIYESLKQHRHRLAKKTGEEA